MEQHDENPDVSGSGDIFRTSSGRTAAREVLKRAVGEVSSNEKFLIWRRRSGLSQKKAGNLVGVGRKKYGQLEKSFKQHQLDIPHLGELYSYELCFILRKRTTWTIPMCAEQMDISRYWYNLMELGKASPERLVQYWIENER